MRGRCEGAAIIDPRDVVTFVVPADAGTHTPRRLFWEMLFNDFA